MSPLYLRYFFSASIKPFTILKPENTLSGQPFAVIGSKSHTKIIESIIALSVKAFPALFIYLINVILRTWTKSPASMRYK